jgi:hypothetical protein
MDNGLLTGDSPAEVETHYYEIKEGGRLEETRKTFQGGHIKSKGDMIMKKEKLIPRPMKEKKVKGRFHEGTCHVCANRVSFFYRLPPRIRIPQETLDRMTEEAEERAKSQIIEGYVQGELNYEDDKFQAGGWWKIKKE